MADQTQIKTEYTSKTMNFKIGKKHVIAENKAGTSILIELNETAKIWFSKNWVHPNKYDDKTIMVGINEIFDYTFIEVENNGQLIEATTVKGLALMNTINQFENVDKTPNKFIYK